MDSFKIVFINFVPKIFVNLLLYAKVLHEALGIQWLAKQKWSLPSGVLKVQWGRQTLIQVDNQYINRNRRNDRVLTLAPLMRLPESGHSGNLNRYTEAPWRGFCRKATGTGSAVGLVACGRGDQERWQGQIPGNWELPKYFLWGTNVTRVAYIEASSGSPGGNYGGI